MSRQGWQGLTSSYSAGDVVAGSDNNIYESLVDNNVGHDPTTDGGVNWKPAGSGPVTRTGDETFDLGTHGPVLVDQSNGHTYRVIATNGVIGLVQVS
jgi:hypothetical protein